MSMLRGTNVVTSPSEFPGCGGPRPAVSTPCTSRDSWQKPDSLSLFRGQCEWVLSDWLVVSRTTSSKVSACSASQAESLAWPQRAAGLLEQSTRPPVLWVTDVLAA